VEGLKDAEGAFKGEKNNYLQGLKGLAGRKKKICMKIKGRRKEGFKVENSKNRTSERP